MTEEQSAQGSGFALTNWSGSVISILLMRAVCMFHCKLALLHKYAYCAFMVMAAALQ